MDRSVYQHMAAMDQRHWWYRARREVLAALIEREVRPPENARILEIGCGTGHNLAMLGQFGKVEALAEQRLGAKVMSAPLPELAEVPKAAYDLVGAFDVIEHIDDDSAALASIAARLKPGGTFVMTVPAHQWMWTGHDVANHHKRRYSKAGLKRLVEGSPLKLEKLGYFNSLLFPLAILERLASKARRKDDAGLSIPPGPLNGALEKAFAAERHLIGRVPFTPGLSLFAVASAR